ncbi:hypothetical protein ACF08B_24440 [Streptomyces sp. NPDC015139]|uniref:hypothetical protein n=1 Tax=Streptomyces sp. NPDC015139 TaxID=3364942 RepID=UPI0036F526CD
MGGYAQGEQGGLVVQAVAEPFEESGERGDHRLGWGRSLLGDEGQQGLLAVQVVTGGSCGRCRR